MVKKGSRILKKRNSHSYAKEIEIKSLMIRIKNRRNNLLSTNNNDVINDLIKDYIQNTPKNSEERYAKRDLIVELSEQTAADDKSYERFGEIVILIIRKILSKPHFSGYTFKDDFYSDAYHKIFKYINNFDHKKISMVTGLPVNSFSYLSQIVHNSVLFIINTHNKKQKGMKDHLNEKCPEHLRKYNNLDSSDASDDIHLSTYESDLKKIDIVNIDTLSYIETEHIMIDFADVNKSDNVYVKFIFGADLKIPDLFFSFCKKNIKHKKIIIERAM